MKEFSSSRTNFAAIYLSHNFINIIKTMIQNDKLTKGIIATQNIVIHLTDTVIIRMTAKTSLMDYKIGDNLNQLMPDNATYTECLLRAILWRNH